jgi:signal transduction histidine kinase
VIEFLRGADDLKAAVGRLENMQQVAGQPVSRDVARHTARGRTFYDRVIGDIIESLRQATSREALIDSVMSALATDVSADAIGYVVLEADLLGHSQASPIRVSSSAGFNASRIQNFIERGRERLAASHLILRVMVEKEAQELLPTELTRGVIYEGEFDDLIDDHKRGAWLCAIPLPNADAVHPARMLVAIYPVIGDPLHPALPRGAEQEWRVLGFLRVAYELLNHQLTNVADVVALHRRDIIADLAPSIVNHEINQQLTILDEGFNVVHYSLLQLAERLKPDDADLVFAAQGLQFSYSALNRLHRIGDAFNNLDRRSPNESVTPRLLLAEIETLAQPRLARAGIETVIQGEALDDEIQTDPALIEHVVLNVLVNAIDAIFQDTLSSSPRGSMRPTITIVAAREAGHLTLVISNNGPPFDFPRPRQIFERGVTSKPLGVGHGLGLHVCRLIMGYLGGSIDLAESKEVPKGMVLGFKIRLPTKGVEITDVMSSTTISPPTRLAKRRG